MVSCLKILLFPFAWINQRDDVVAAERNQVQVAWRACMKAIADLFAETKYVPIGLKTAVFQIAEPGRHAQFRRGVGKSRRQQRQLGGRGGGGEQRLVIHQTWRADLEIRFLLAFQKARLLSAFDVVPDGLT